MIYNNFLLFSTQIVFKMYFDKTTPNSSSSLTLFFLSQKFKSLEVKAMGFHPSTVSCSREAASPAREASP